MLLAAACVRLLRSHILFIDDSATLAAAILQIDCYFLVYLASGEMMDSYFFLGMDFELDGALSRVGVLVLFQALEFRNCVCVIGLGQTCLRAAK